MKPHVFNFNTMPGYNVWYKRNDVSKGLSHFHIGIMSCQRLLLKVPIEPLEELLCASAHRIKRGFLQNNEGQ